jgi:hypothetical protein
MRTHASHPDPTVLSQHRGHHTFTTEGLHTRACKLWDNSSARAHDRLKAQIFTSPGHVYISPGTYLGHVQPIDTKSAVPKRNGFSGIGTNGERLGA